MEKSWAPTPAPRPCKRAKKQAGGYYDYSLYDDCTYDNGFDQQQYQFTPSRDGGSARRRRRRNVSLGGALNDYPCGGDPIMDSYFQLDVVKEAFHVTSEFFNVDNGADFDYTSTEKSVEKFYQSVNGKVRVLVYNGDSDPSINSFEAQNWTHHLGFAIEEDWRPWTIDGCRRMGGYVTRYAGKFDFLTIRGSGHMVPTYKPAASFAFLQAWLDDTDYPTYDPNCYRPTQKTQLQQQKPLQMSSNNGDSDTDDDDDEEEEDIDSDDSAPMMMGMKTSLRRKP